MFRFNIKLLLNNRILVVWPLAAIVFPIIIGLLTDVQTAAIGYSSFMGIFIFIAVVSIPAHLNENLEPEQAALLFSKPVSRSQFFFAEFGSVLAITFVYSLITAVGLAVLLLLDAGVFSLQFYLAILIFTPLSFLVLYVSIVMLLVLTDSYLSSVLIGYLVIPLISIFLLKNEHFLKLVGWDSDFLLGLADVLSYIIPSSAGISILTEEVLSTGFAAIDWQLFGFVIISCLPFFLLSYYLMNKKEF